jgi:hypothetical protein
MLCKCDSNYSDLLVLRSLSMVTKQIGLQHQLTQFCAGLMYRVDLTNAALVSGAKRACEGTLERGDERKLVVKAHV